MGIRKDGGDDSEDDDDIVIGVGENFLKHIDALKRACVLEVGHGGYISTPASILSGETTTPCEEDEEEEEDDEELFLSIKSKYGSFGYGDSPWLEKRTSREKKLDTIAGEAEEDDEEEDDEELLRSVERLYRSGGGNGQLSLLPKPVSPPKDNSGANDAPKVEKETRSVPSPHTSPEYEPGGNGEGEDGGLSPQTRSETSVEATEDVGRSISSFLPGSWIDTDRHVEHCDPSPAGPLEIISYEHGDSNLSEAPKETKTYSQPEKAHILTDALKKNRQCQRTLRNMLSQVEEKQKQNAELQRRVKSLVDFEKYCNRRFAGFFTDQSNPSLKLIAIKAPPTQIKPSDPSNKTDSDVQTCGPPENSDVEIYKKLRKKISFTFPTRRWSNEERIELAKGVKQQVFEVLVMKAMDTLSNADALEEEFDSLDDHMSKIGGKEFTPQQIRDAVPGVDWAEVARLYVVGRTPEECRTRWINHEDPLINKHPWKKLEDKKLLSIAQQHNFCTWETIAEQLGTNRTAAECLIRYQRSLNASIMRSNWTPEEDNRLRAAVEEWGENDWSAVAACLEGRNNSQCLMRWYKVLHPSKKKRGRWSVEEDKRLKWAVSVYGPKKWKQIAEHVPGRTDLQCRERWCNVLDPSIKLGEWTEDEDRMLEESVAKHGPHRWAAVANDLKIRTDNQCCRRWKFLHPEDQQEFQRTVHIRRTALVGNFQGRKKERPRLGPQDFISKDADFEIPARKPTAKKIVKDRQRKGSIEKRGDGNAIQSIAVDGPRERRAARMLKRKLAKARKASNDGAQVSVFDPDVQADKDLTKIIYLNDLTDIIVSNARPDAVNTALGNLDRSVERSKRKAAQISDPIVMFNRPSKRTNRKAHVADPVADPSNRSDKGTKRKAVQFADPVEPRKRTNLNGSKLIESVRVSHSQDTSEKVQSVGPEIFSFVDLVQSLENYCKYCCLLDKEENRLEKCSHDSETQEPARGDRIEHDFDSNTGPDLQLLEVRGKALRGMSSSDPGNGQISYDEEVASATRAILSWPFLRGVQEHWSQGTTYLGSLGGTDLGPQGLTNSRSQGKTALVSQGKKGSAPKGRTYLGSQGTTEFGSQGKTQGRTNLGSEGRTYLASPGRTVLRSQRTTALAATGLVELAAQGITDLGFHGITGLGTHELTVWGPQGRTDLGSQPTTRLGSQGGTDLGSQGSSDLGSNGKTGLATRLGSEGETHLGSQGRADLSSQVRTEVGSEGMTDLDSPGVKEFGSQRTTYSGSHVLSQNAVKTGTTDGDSGSITSATVKKPRSKRIVRMRGTIPWEKTDKRSLVAPTRRPRKGSG